MHNCIKCSDVESWVQGPWRLTFWRLLCNFELHLDCKHAIYFGYMKLSPHSEVEECRCVTENTADCYIVFFRYPEDAWLCCLDRCVGEPCLSGSCTNIVAKRVGEFIQWNIKFVEFSGITNVVCWKFELHFCTFMQIFDILLLFL